MSESNGVARMESEEALVAHLLHSPPEAVHEVVEAGVRPEVFYSPMMGRLFAGMVAASAHGEINQETVFNRLDGAAQDDREWLERAREPNIGALGRTDLARKIITSWRRERCKRHIMAASCALEQGCLWDDQYSAAAEELRQAIECGAQQPTRRLRDMAIQAEAKLRRKIEHGGACGLTTGFADWDRECQPLGSEFTVIAGRPSTGKSSLAAQLAMTWIKSEPTKAVIYFSIEDPAEDLIERMAIQVSGQNPGEVSCAKPADREAWLARVLKFGGLQSRLHLFDGERSADDIEATTRLLASSCQISAVIVDYLQLVSVCRGSERQDRIRQVGQMTRRFKLLSSALRIPVVVLAQLNRGNEREGNREPVLIDLRESGDIEQDADRVWLLWRPDKRSDGEPQDDGQPRVDVVWKQAKMRGGPKVKGWFSFDKPHFSFSWKPTVTKFIRNEKIA